MTPEERWKRIEEKHAALAETVETLGRMQRSTEVQMNKMSASVERLVSTVEQLAGVVRSHEERINRPEGGR